MSDTEIPKVKEVKAVKEYPCHKSDCDKVYRTVVGRWKHTMKFHPELKRKKPPSQTDEVPEVIAEASPDVKKECCENCARLKEVINLLMKV